MMVKARRKVSLLLKRLIAVILVMISAWTSFSAEVRSATVGGYDFSYTILSGSCAVIGDPEYLQTASRQKECKPEKFKPAIVPVPTGCFEIPESLEGFKVVGIGDAAFVNCVRVAKIVVPNTVTNIGAGAFYNCRSLVDIELPASLKKIGERAFWNCKSLKRLVLPPGVVAVDDDVVLGCEGLEFVRFPASLESWRCNTLAGHNIKSVWFDDGCEYVANYMFQNCKQLVNVRLPKSIKCIDRCAFEGCESLLRMDLPEGLEVLRSGAFRGCAVLKDITIPETVRLLEADVFDGTRVKMEVGRDGEMIKDGWTFGWQLDKARNGNARDVVVSKDRHKLALGATSRCPSEVNLIFDESLAEDMCYDRMSELTYNTNIAKVIIRSPIGTLRPDSHVTYFSGCTGVREIELPDTITNLPHNCFSDCTNLVRLVMPKDYIPSVVSDVLPKSPNLLHELAYSDTRSLFGALLYLDAFYEDDILSFAQTKRFDEVRSRISGFVKEHPDCFTKEMQNVLFELDLQVLNKMRCSFSWMQDRLNAPHEEISNNEEYWRLLGGDDMPEETLEIMRKEAGKRKRWDSFAKDVKRQMLSYARRNFEMMCEIFERAYDYPRACKYLMDYRLRKFNAVEMVDMYKRMARYQACLMTLYPKDYEAYSEERSDMFKYLQKISDMGYGQQSQMLQLELENKLKNHRTVTQTKQPRTGTGWFINDTCIATCWHVVAGSNDISVEFPGGVRTKAKILAKDPVNDVVVLKISGTGYNHDSLPIRPRNTKIADKVFTVGYPLASLLGQSQKYTDGTISSLSGVGGDGRYFQISTPMQPGNSGGPLVDESGAVIGLTSAALNAVSTALRTGAIPQNVNYAIKVRYLTALLDDTGIDYVIAEPMSKSLNAVESVTKAVVLIVAE